MIVFEFRLKMSASVLVLSGDIDVEKYPNLPTTRNLEAVPFISVAL